MRVTNGDLECKAIYKGDLLLWAITENSEGLSDVWDDELLWDDEQIWTET